MENQQGIDCNDEQKTEEWRSKGKEKLDKKWGQAIGLAQSTVQYVQDQEGTVEGVYSIR
jgi:hypothetical protein